MDNSQKINDLIIAVAKMRTYQKQYFAQPSKDRLINSKHYENQVDKLLTEIQAKQLNLF